MTATLVHRGPDAEGLWVNGSVGLGQRRLSVIDLSEAATPPLCNEDGSLWVVFNGEIYNFLSLRRELEACGHRFSTRSDTEVIVHLYEEYGINCVQKLRGMFAFAIWNTKSQELFAARDPVGKKPFYYSIKNNRLIFASEIKAITTDRDFVVTPNLVALDQYLTWQYVPSPLSGFAGISKLPAGHFLKYSQQGGLKTERYWYPPDGQFHTSRRAEEYDEEFESLVRAAVCDRLVADVPVGALLSGGIDSGLVTAVMAQSTSQPVETFTVGFEDPTYDERASARKVSERYGTRHHETLVGPSIVRELPALIRHYNEPFGDYSSLPTFQLANLARKHVTVALGGDGGDEAFSGYLSYGKALRWGAFDVLPRYLRRALAAGGSLIATVIPRTRLRTRLHEGSAVVAGDLLSRYVRQLQIFKEVERRALYRDALRDIAADNVRDRVRNVAAVTSSDGLNVMMAHDLMYTLPDWLLVKMDVASMAHSLEVRSPLLDVRIIEFAAKVPEEFRRVDDRGKLMLRRLASKLLPYEVAQGKKRGFSVPMGEWFRGELRSWLREVLLDGGQTLYDIVRRDFVEQLIDEHDNRLADWTHRLWVLIVLEYWFREFFEGSTSQCCEASFSGSSPKFSR